MTEPNPPVVARPTNVRWWIFTLACVASWLLYLHRYSWGVIKPTLKKEFPSLTDQDWGWLDSAFLATYAFGQVPGGAAGDYFGPRGVLSVLVLLWTVAGTAVAWVPGSQLMFGAVRSLFGLAQAGAYPVLSKVTSRWFPFSIRTGIQGSIAAFGRVGGACASVLIATVLMGLLGLTWRTSLAVLAVPGIILAVAVFAVFRSGPRQHPWCNEAECKLIEGDDPPAPAGSRPVLHFQLGSGVTFGMMLLYTFLSTFCDQLFVFWIPLFLKEGKGLSDHQMGIFATLPLLGGAAGGIVAGFLNDYMVRRAGPRFGRSIVAFTGKSLAALLIAASVPIEDGRLVMVALFLCRFFNDWSLSSLWGAITDVSGRAAGTLFGIVNTAGAMGGIVAGPIMGQLKTDYGWDGLFYIVARIYLAAGICWLAIDCTKKMVIERETTPGDA